MNVKKNQKIFCLVIFFLFLLSASFFCLSVNRVSAAGLEVQYPVISGQTITAETKLPDYIKYIFNFGMALGFLAVFISLAIAGSMYLLSPAKPDLRASAKDRTSGAISGLLILVLTYLIITTINPQLSFFYFNSLPAQTITTPTEKASGVYFYKDTGCPIGNSAQSGVDSFQDLGKLKNIINSVAIVQNKDAKIYYVSILYDTINFQGSCQYLNPNVPCSSVPIFQPSQAGVSSASIHTYDFEPNGDGVYFFRKTCFNKTGDQNDVTDGNGNYDFSTLIDYCKKNSGGWYRVDNSQIKGILSGNNGDLNSLCFTGDSSGPGACNDSGACTVPKDEQDCVKYNKNGVCTARKCPTLAGENISSLIINGYYLVLFVYQGPGGTAAGPWASCQEFPGIYDTNQLGPQQMKWENIRNRGQGIPNYVLIIPVKS